MLVNEVLTFQRNLIEHYKKELERSKGDLDSRAYIAEQKRYRLDYERVDFNELKASMTRADVIAIGDVHDYQGSLHFLIELIKSLRSYPIAVGLEGLLAGEDITIPITRKEAKTRMYSSFQNDRPYQQLISELTKRGIPVYGLSEERKSVQERDIISARIISRKVRGTTKQVIFIGEAHLCPDHLPYEIQKATAQHQRTVTQTVILQNLETIYFQLAGENMSGNPEIVRLRHSRQGIERFCIINSPPAEKLYSLAYALHLPAEREEYIRTQIGITARFLNDMFSSKREKKREEEIEERYQLCVNRRIGRNHRRKIKEELDCIPSSKLPIPTGIYGTTAYLSKINLGHIAQIAGGMLFEERNQQNTPDDAREIQREMWAHFCSYLINPYRYSKSLEEVTWEAEQETDTLNSRIARGTLEALEKDWLPNEEKIVQRWIAYRAGQFKGRQLYNQYITRKITREDIKNMLFEG
jgi:hypothetical protein